MAKILIADNNNKSLVLLGLLLKDAGYEVIFAVSGPETLRKVRKESPEVLVLDLMIPKMDGLKVIQDLRQDPRSKDMPILLVTAQSGAETQGLEMGADDYSIKPINSREILQKIKRYL